MEVALLGGVRAPLPPHPNSGVKGLAGRKFHVWVWGWGSPQPFHGEVASRGPTRDDPNFSGNPRTFQPYKLIFCDRECAKMDARGERFLTSL